MTSPQDKHPHLDGEATSFIARLARHYTPAPLTPSQGAAFEEVIWERLQKRSQRLRLVPAVVSVAAVALIAWLTLGGPLSSRLPQSPMSGTVVAQAPPGLAWDEVAFLAIDATDSSDTDSNDTDDNDILPDDYMAIAQVFLDQS
jgi:hypothetical protein